MSTRFSFWGVYSPIKTFHILNKFVVPNAEFGGAWLPSRGLFKITEQYLQLILKQDRAQQADSVGGQEKISALVLPPERKEGWNPTHWHFPVTFVH